MLRRAEWSILVLFIMLAVSTTVWAMLGDGGALAQVGAVVSWFSVVARGATRRRSGPPISASR